MDRMYQHKKSKYSHISSAVECYGADDMRIEVIFKCEGEYKYLFETAFILLHDTISPKGYNSIYSNPQLLTMDIIIVRYVRYIEKNYPGDYFYVANTTLYILHSSTEEKINLVDLSEKRISTNLTMAIDYTKNLWSDNNTIAWSLLFSYGGPDNMICEIRHPKKYDWKRTGESTNINSIKTISKYMLDMKYFNDREYTECCKIANDMFEKHKPISIETYLRNIDTEREQNLHQSTLLCSF
jgi:hypothetical protein